MKDLTTFSVGVKGDHGSSHLTGKSTPKSIYTVEPTAISSAYLVWPPLELLSQRDWALDRNALLVQVGLTFTAGGASFRVERGSIQPSPLTQPQHRLALTQQL